MSNTIPTSQLILGYKDVFRKDPSSDRIGMLSGMCRDQLIAEISRLNYALKPKETKHQDTTLNTQKEQLFYMCGENIHLHNEYLALLKGIPMSKNDYPIFFTRPTCLFAIEEIIGSDLKYIPDFNMSVSWAKLLNYLLAVNTTLTKMQNKEEDNPTNEEVLNRLVVDEEQEEKKSETLSPFEEVNSKIIILNELSLSSDPVYTSYRGYQLLLFLTEHLTIGSITKEYLSDSYDMGYQQFVYELLSMYSANNVKKENNIRIPGRKEIDTTFIYYPSKGAEQLFINLSQMITNSNPATLLSVRKFPFYKAEIGYFLIDNVFLLDKCYYQFVNDFWFDKVKQLKNEKGKALFDVRGYRAIIGDFLEKYLRSIVSYCFQNAKHFHVYKFEELKLMVNKNEIELTDLYIRFSDNVFMAELKSTGIYDSEKYSGNIDLFYRKNRKDFFDSFGMEQICTALTNRCQ